MFSSVLAAQLEGPENCVLRVRVSTSNERTVEEPIQIQVLSTRGVVATVSLIGDDYAQIQVASGKSYRLTVSGTGIEAITTPYFEIGDLEREHTETVHVKPKNPLHSEESPAGTGTISISEMDIPKKASLEMKKGLDAYSKGDMKTAASHFETATADYPRYARAFDMLGAIAMKGSDRAKARDFFSKSIEADVTFSPAYVDLARLDLQDKRYAESESLLAKAISFNPSLPDAVALLATTEFANKEYEKALADVQRTHALRNHEQFAEVHLMAGRVLRMQNHPDAAIEQFQLFLKEKPDSPEGESVRKEIHSLEAGRHP